MYAVIKTGGKQYKVSQGDVLRVEQLAAAEGTDISFDEVLLVADGGNIQVGTPTVEGTSVTANVIKHGRGKKIDIIKFKRRKHHYKHTGHRQNYTEIEITSIGGKAAPKKAGAKAATAESKKTAAKSESVRLKKPEGEADDLKQIDGLGPKIAEKLNDAGIFHFWQIAQLKKADIAELEEELKIVGRFERDEWVKQAKALAKKK